MQHQSFRSDETAARDLVGVPAPRGPARPRALPPFLPHLVTLLGALFSVSIVRDVHLSLVLLGSCAAGFSVAVTLKHGGAFLPPSSVYFLASGVFIGGGIYYLLIVGSEVPLVLIRDAAAIALTTTIGISLVTKIVSERWNLRWPSASTAPSASETDLTPGAVPAAGVAMMVASQIGPVSSFVGPTVYSLGLGGVMLVVVWASSRWRRVKWFGDLAVVALVFTLPYFWVQLTFSGGGRLMVAGVSIAAFMVWNLFNPSRTQKLLLVLCIPVFLLLAGLNRAADEDTTGSAVISQGDGLASVYSPLETFGRIVGTLDREQSQEFGPRFGETFLNSAYLPIPRSLWPDKPEGFGSELTAVLEPKLVKSNHSMAALFQSEWMANFGFWGLVLMVPTVGTFLAWLDRKHARLVAEDFSQDGAWWRLAALACLASSLGDLSWVGTFTMYARGGLAALYVWLVSRFMLARRRPGALENAYTRDFHRPAGRADEAPAEPEPIS